MYETKLKSMGLKLPPVPKPVAAYVPAVMVDKYIYTSGQLPLVEGNLEYQGDGREPGQC